MTEQEMMVTIRVLASEIDRLTFRAEYAEKRWREVESELQAAKKELDEASF